MASHQQLQCKRRTFLIQDPGPGYALELVRRIYTMFGLRPVCFYTDRKAKFYTELETPELSGGNIEDSYFVSDLPSFAAEIAQHYDIVGIVPHTEITVGPAAELCRLLKIDWNPYDVLARFRDKNQQKRQLADAGVRVPYCRIVKAGENLTTGYLPDRFVLKPNDGFGNVGIGVFGAGEVPRAQAHIADASTTWLLEEYIDGPEFNINGQVRANGQVDVYAVFSYIRRSVNGYETVYDSEIQCPSTHPLFSSLRKYAVDVMVATQLRRSPFHLEVKVDQLGPCMIDLGARFSGMGAVHAFCRSHPGIQDSFAIAAHDYITDAPRAVDALDWQRHDRQLSIYVYGVAEDQGIVDSIDGVDSVEALPEFISWPSKPSVGMRLRPTRELLSAPYVAEMRFSGDEADLASMLQKIRSPIRFHIARNSFKKVLLILASKRSTFLRRLKWEFHRLTHR